MYKLTWINEEDGGDIEGAFPNLFEAKMAAWLIASELDENDTIQAWENNVDAAEASEFEIDEFTLPATAAAEWSVTDFGDPHATITLNESGWDTGMSFVDYCRQARMHGDNPADYSTDIEDFAFVGWEYAQNDPRWSDIPEGWPESLPLWEYRPA